MNRLRDEDLQVLRVTAARGAELIPPLVEAIARELYAHPEARPYYRSQDQVRGQARAWVLGILGHADLDALDAFLLRVARVHHALGIPAPFFAEICAMISDHVGQTLRDRPFTEEVRARVERTFNRVLFRQIQLYLDAPAP